MENIKRGIERIKSFIEISTKSISMTPEEIRVALGLKPFNIFRDEAVLKNSNYHREYLHYDEVEVRQTGRTTEILCNLLAEVSRGHSTMIIGEYPYISMLLRDKAIIMAKKLGLNYGLIMAGKKNKKYPTDVIKVFYDHKWP